MNFTETWLSPKALMTSVSMHVWSQVDMGVWYQVRGEQYAVIQEQVKRQVVAPVYNATWKKRGTRFE